MTDSDGDRRHVREVLTQRRQDLSPEYKKLAAFSRATGVNYKTLQRLESGAEHTFATGTLLELDRAYQYPSGTIARLIEGHAPPTGPILVPAGGRPPIEATDPELRLRDKPPLRDGELLEAWVRPDGKWHYHYASDGLDLRTSFDASIPLEDAVRKLRAMAAIHRSDM